ncbi:MAG: hypothetical protein K6G48_02105 [Acholeplasmatales bacterium]|nr:hypothetical protein [Acholeplasmatales bacterium]
MSIQETYNTINEVFSQTSKKWEKGLIGHKKKVEVIAGTAEFHNDEIISYDTGFSSATELTYEAVGDFISFDVKEYGIKNWWGDWDRCSSIKEMEAKILYHTYQTIIYSDGTFVSKNSRTYLD